MSHRTNEGRRTVRTYGNLNAAQHCSGRRIGGEGQKNAVRSAAALAVGASLIVGVAGCSAPWGATQAQSSTASEQTANKSKVPAASAGASSASKAQTATNSDSDSTSAAQAESSGSSASSSSSATPKDTYASNPRVKLPTKIAPSIPNDATIVSPQYAQLTNGDVVDLQTGQKVTNPNIVGSEDSPADPLAKSDGSNFIPTKVGSVREQMRAAGNAAGAATDSSSSSSSSQGSAGTSDFVEKSDNNGAVHGSFSRLIFANGDAAANSALIAQPISLPNNSYGAHWGTYDGTPAFFMRNGRLFAQQASGVVDVSEWQGTINWEAAKRAGVQGAIIRLGYGWGNGIDHQALRNISECKRLHIPFGVYLYSYAYNSSVAAKEGDSTVALLRKAGVSPSDLSYPIYYDLEAYSWAAHPHPTSPAVYRGIVDAWYSRLQAAGYRNLGVYSYTSYLNNQLNDASIHAKTSWVADYGPSMNFTRFGSNHRGWQYTSCGKIAGIPSGCTDLDAFGYAQRQGGARPASQVTPTVDLTRLPQVQIPNGTYYINMGTNNGLSLDVPGASHSDVQLQTYTANGSAAQQWRFTRNSDGSYTIINVASGKAIDIPGAKAGLNAVVHQFASNGTRAQHWYLRRAAGGGIYLQSALGNWALDVPGASKLPGQKMHLYAPNGSAAQVFYLSSVVPSSTVPTNATVKIVSALSPNTVVDVAGASKSNGARIDVYNWNGTGAQIFRLIAVGNGQYEIMNVNSGKVLDIPSGNTAGGTDLQQFDRNNSQAQVWFIRDAGNGYYSLMNRNSGRMLDVSGASTANGTRLDIWDSNGTNAQKWRFVPASVTPVSSASSSTPSKIVPPSRSQASRAPQASQSTTTNQANQMKNQTNQADSKRASINAMAAANRNAIADGTYSIAGFAGTTWRLDLAGASKQPGANVRIWHNNGTDAQQWIVRHDSDGYVTFISRASGLALDLAGGQATNGNNVRQWTPNGTYAQKWIVSRVGSYYRIASAVDPSYVLDITDSRAADGTNVQVWTGAATRNQTWTFFRD